MLHYTEGEINVGILFQGKQRGSLTSNIVGLTPPFSICCTTTKYFVRHILRLCNSIVYEVEFFVKHQPLKATLLKGRDMTEAGPVTTIDELA